MRHKNTLDELKAAVSDCKLEGRWAYNERNRFHVFLADGGEILNWWPKTGTLQLQGVPNEVVIAGLKQTLAKHHRQQLQLALSSEQQWSMRVRTRACLTSPKT